MNEDEHLKKLNDLEAKFSFQADILEDLNGTVSKQWHEIDSLKQQINLLKGQILELSDQKTYSLDNPPPPHY